jgi:hypothetical protein
MKRFIENQFLVSKTRAVTLDVSIGTIQKSGYEISHSKLISYKLAETTNIIPFLMVAKVASSC